ncbi:MAG: class I SAM-dependent methyltransferase [Nocardioides sp.]|nr:class I SAM-dependent methyltransferase [Nocardioides sp.]
MTDSTMSTIPTTMTTAEALDAAFSGRSCELVHSDGRHRPLATDRWTGAASPSDHALFVDRCRGTTLDLGCGPGRLSGALQDRGVDVLGVDISSEAVRLTKARGAPALCRDAFTDLPGTGSWTHVLLADGNVGLGGRPEHLLRRVAKLLAPRGTALVELASAGAVSIHADVHLRVGDRFSGSFDWATVGVEAIDDVAGAADLVVTDLVSMAGRHVATLQHRTRARTTR